MAGEADTAGPQPPFRSPLRAALLFWLICTLVCAGVLWGTNRLQTGSGLASMGARAEATVRLQRELITERYRSVVGDVQIAAGHVELDDWLQSPSETERQLDLHHLEVEYLRLAGYRGYSLQIGLSNAEGRPLVWVDAYGGTPRLVRGSVRGEASDQERFREAAALPQGHVLVSRFVLPSEKPASSVALEPSICFATPVRNAAGALRGVVSLHFRAEDLLGRVRRLEPDTNLESMLLDSDGNWLLGRQRDSRQGAPQEGRRRPFRQELAAEWAHMQAERHGRLQTANGLFTFASVDPVTLLGDRVRAAGQPTMWVVHRVPPALLEDLSAPIETTSFVLFAALQLVIALGALAIAHLASQRRAAWSTIRQLADRDTLTGVWNRRKLMELLKREIGRAERYHLPFSIAMVDLDHFKSINDTYGHLVGDRVLTQVCKLIQAEGREVDFVGRFGGEEFVVGLPETDIVGALTFAERVRAVVAGSPVLDEQGRPFTATASIGVAQYCAGESLEALLRRADEGLYEAKRAGRNRATTTQRPSAPVSSPSEPERDSSEESRLEGV